jgi:hypothetical protein
MQSMVEGAAGGASGYPLRLAGLATSPAAQGRNWYQRGR